MRHSPPSLRPKNDHGKLVAVVTLPDSSTKPQRRRDFYCGTWDTPESRTRYSELIFQWETAGRRWPCQNVVDGISIAEIILQYWRWAETYYTPSESLTIKSAWKVLDAHCGELAADEFGPIKLREVRQLMIEKKWNRNHINKQIHRIGAIFKWAAGQELLPITVYQSLKSVEPLKRGKCLAPEPEAIQPVALEHVAAVKPFVSRQVWAIIELQRLTGSRPGELLTLRRRDINCTDEIWRLSLDEHKTAHHGKDRTVYFGPQAQAVLAEWMMRPDDAYLFSPQEAENERIQIATQNRKTPDNKGNVAAGRRREDLGECYTTASYRRAIARAIEKVNASAETPIPHWHPHQLRHTAATEIRKRFGLEAAQIVLGHSSARITDAVYAQRDRGKVEDVMRQIG